ncbi:MAG: hypothetical protein LUH63_16100 [Parabacteroides sp.]|nr:hypothetical protein [Parabacteroides sp.]
MLTRFSAVEKGLFPHWRELIAGKSTFILFPPALYRPEDGRRTHTKTVAIQMKTVIIAIKTVVVATRP